MNLQHHVSLRTFNTFGIESFAEQYLAVHSVPELLEAVRLSAGAPLRILGGGSNILLTSDVAGQLLHIRIPGRQVESAKGNTAVVSAGAGENWHALVQWCLAQNFGGLENLSLIPGSVGASPIQNIGAYGVELADVFDHLEAVDMHTGEIIRLDGPDCAFGYRDSFFKREGKGRYCITKVFFRLSMQEHRLHCDYGAIRDTLANMGITTPTIHDVSHAVIHIRQSKLPDPADTGNAGSFFKNPEVSTEKAESMRQVFPQMPVYTMPNDRVKIPAGWLIEQCGWKGFRQGDAGCYPQQALVLVNYGRATGAEILNLAKRIAASVEERFGIVIEPEVNVW